MTFGASAPRSSVPEPQSTPAEPAVTKPKNRLENLFDALIWPKDIMKYPIKVNRVHRYFARNVVRALTHQLDTNEKTRLYLHWNDGNLPEIKSQTLDPLVIWLSEGRSVVEDDRFVSLSNLLTAFELAEKCLSNTFVLVSVLMNNQRNLFELRLKEPELTLEHREELSLDERIATLSIPELYIALNFKNVKLPTNLPSYSMLMRPVVK